MNLSVVFQPKFLLLSASLLIVSCDQQIPQKSSLTSVSNQPAAYMPRVTIENSSGSEGILVKFKGAIGSVSRSRSLSTAGLVERGTFNLVPGLTRAEPLPGFTVDETLIALSNDTTVAYAEPDYLLNSSLVPNDSQFEQQYALDNRVTPSADISATEAWNITVGSSENVLAVIDSGVDYNHQDLQANIWRNIDEIDGNGIDDDQNGYIDDIRGWNFNSNNNDPMDDNNHGTHVAGIIGASGNNTLGVSGVNWNVKIMPLKFMNSRGQGRTSAAIDAIEYAVKNGARVSNNSWGGSAFSQALFDAIQAANTAGHLFIAAAGNDGSDNDRVAQYPSNYNLPNIIAVTATDQNDRLATFSNFGNQTVDLAAPGVSILSTVRNNQYANLSGTSMATPFVTGATGLLLAQNKNLSVVQIKDLLLKNVDVVSALSSNIVSGGRLNIFSALNSVSAVPSLPGALPTNPNPVNPTPVESLPVTPVPVTSGPEAGPVITAIAIVPNVQEVAIGASKQLTASGGVSPYIWTVDNLTLASINSTTGVFRALTVGQVSVIVTDSTGAASDPYIVKLIPMGILPKNTTQIGLNETITFSADGGVGPYTWKISDESIAVIKPAGLELRELIVSPNTTGTFTISLYDTTGNTAVTKLINVVDSPLVVTPITSTLNIGQTIQLNVSGGTSPYLFTSTDPLVASVDGGGLIKALVAGAATIQVADFNDQRVNVNIIVLNNLSLDQSSVLIAVNGTLLLRASGGSGVYLWSTSNASVATVSGSGLVRGVSSGVAVVTLRDDTGLEQSASIEVRQVKINGLTNTTVGSAGIQLSAVGGSAPYLWVSSNPVVASINSTGLVTPVTPGTVSVTASDADGFSATISVTVNAAAPTAVPAPTAPAPAPAPVATTGSHH